jgi:periplasmic copper chaperone A
VRTDARDGETCDRAVYFMVSNQRAVADRLVEAAVADMRGVVEIHDSIMEGGQAEMRPVEGVEIPAGGSAAFEPGGYHVMLLDLDAPLEVGDMLEITLTFEAARDVDVSAEVRPFVEDDGMGGENDGDLISAARRVRSSVRSRSADRPLCAPPNRRRRRRP